MLFSEALRAVALRAIWLAGANALRLGVAIVLHYVEDDRGTDE